MSFWDLSTGESAKDTGKEFDGGGGDIQPIPNNSVVQAIISKAGWKHKDANDTTSPRFVELTWDVMAPEEVKNRKIFQKVWVGDYDPEALKKGEDKAKAKRDKARRMFAAIDANAGGNLVKSGDAPTDESLMMHLTGKPMLVTVMVWSMKGSTGEDMSGNWVRKVEANGGEVSLSNEPLPKPSGAPAGGGYAGGTYGGGLPGNDMDDEIPFKAW